MNDNQQQIGKLVTREELQNLFDENIEKVGEKPEYKDLIARINKELTARASRGDRLRFSIPVPFEFHSRLTIDLGKANLKYVICGSSFEIGF